MIAIHAAKRRPDAMLGITIGGMDIADLPLGVIVGTAEIADCLPIEALYGTAYDTPLERSFGDWKQGRYGWILHNPIKFEAPIIASGHQRFWGWNE